MQEYLILKSEIEHRCMWNGNYVVKLTVLQIFAHKKKAKKLHCDSKIERQ